MIQQAKHDLGHLSDGELVRYIDGVCDAAEARGVEDHMESCSGCRSRLERTRVRFGRLSEALALADFPGADGSAAGVGVEFPDRKPASAGRRVSATHAASWRPSTRRIAASIAVLLGAGLAFSPVRAWVGQGLTRILPASAPVDAPLPDRFSVVLFAPQGLVFTIEVTTPQAVGELVLEVTSDTRVSSRIEGGSGREELVVLPSGLRVETGGAVRRDLPCERAHVVEHGGGVGGRG